MTQWQVTLIIAVFLALTFVDQIQINKLETRIAKLEYESSVYTVVKFVKYGV